MAITARSSLANHEIRSAAQPQPNYLTTDPLEDWSLEEAADHSPGREAGVCAQWKRAPKVRHMTSVPVLRTSILYLAGALRLRALRSGGAKGLLPLPTELC